MMLNNVPDFFKLWVYLSASPLLGLTLTICAYVIALSIYNRSRHSPLFNPVAISILIIALVLKAVQMPYAEYFSGAQFVHFLLGPATVALAIPLARQLPKAKHLFYPILAALIAGSCTAIISAVTSVLLLGGSYQLAMSIAPKSVTTPIAMAVSERLGGLPSLTAVMVIATGILGAILGNAVFSFMRIDSHQIRGFALGVAAHGIGTARAFQVSSEMGAFSGLAMGLNGVLTAFLAPWLVPQIVQLMK
ncbi:putative murein hydrolase (TIGR00659 family) [Oxalobacteraceae bacterium GrIS 2.11]